MSKIKVKGCRLLPTDGDAFCGAPDDELAICKHNLFNQRFAFHCPYVLVPASRLLWWHAVANALPLPHLVDSR